MYVINRAIYEGTLLLGPNIAFSVFKNNTIEQQQKTKTNCGRIQEKMKNKVFFFVCFCFFFNFVLLLHKKK